MTTITLDVDPARVTLPAGPWKRPVATSAYWWTSCVKTCALSRGLTMPIHGLIHEPSPFCGMPT